MDSKAVVERALERMWADGLVGRWKQEYWRAPRGVMCFAGFLAHAAGWRWAQPWTWRDSVRHALHLRSRPGMTEVVNDAGEILFVARVAMEILDPTWPRHLPLLTGNFPELGPAVEGSDLLRMLERRALVAIPPPPGSTTRTARRDTWHQTTLPTWTDWAPPAGPPATPRSEHA